MFELKRDSIYIAKANLKALNEDKTGVFFNVSVADLISSVEKLINTVDTPVEDIVLSCKILPLNHKSDKFTHSVKIEIK